MKACVGSSISIFMTRMECRFCLVKFALFWELAAYKNIHKQTTPPNDNLIKQILFLQDLLKPHFAWENLFEPFPYSKSYLRFIKICLSTYDKDELASWVHWVKSHICSLLVKLEELHAFCDPNPTEYTDMSIELPNVVFYWGLVPGRGDNLNLNVATEDFMKILGNGHQGGNLGDLTLTMVQASQLPETLELADSHIKALLRSNLVNHQQQPLIPVYSVHSPLYVVGYLATSGYPEHPHDVDSFN